MSKFTTEHQPATRGRNPGSMNRTTGQARDMIIELLEGHSDRFKESLEKLKPRDFVDMYLRLLKMILPKEFNARIDYASLTDQQLDTIINSILENHESNITSES